MHAEQQVLEVILDAARQFFAHGNQVARQRIGFSEDEKIGSFLPIDPVEVVIA